MEFTPAYQTHMYHSTNSSLLLLQACEKQFVHPRSYRAHLQRVHKMKLTLLKGTNKLQEMALVRHTMDTLESGIYVIILIKQAISLRKYHLFK
jgi:hypothetical protein